MTDNIKAITAGIIISAANISVIIVFALLFINNSYPPEMNDYIIESITPIMALPAKQAYYLDG